MSRDTVSIASIKRHPFRAASVTIVALGLTGLVGGELFLRARYGLGDPPRMMADPLTEYRYVPDRHYRRRGNAIDINHYSMRSEDFPASRTSPEERRVLVIGDSVVNGGAQTDQSQLATSILRQELTDRLGMPCVVGNASAASWGPENMDGYVRRFGLFESDVVVIVVSSHDAFDEVKAFPSGERIDPAPYWFAWSEAFATIRARWTNSTAPAAEPVPGEPGNSTKCLAAFGDLIDRVTASGAKPVVAFHFERPELDAPDEPVGHALLREVCAARGIAPILLRDAFKTSLAAGKDPYRDEIHPNVVGQRLIAETIEPAIEDALMAMRSH